MFQVQVRVVSFGADREVILSHLNTAATDGHWLVFNNCQLLETWDTQVTAHIHQLISSLRGRESTKHTFKSIYYQLLFIRKAYNNLCFLL